MRILLEDKEGFVRPPRTIKKIPTSVRFIGYFPPFPFHFSNNLNILKQKEKRNMDAIIRLLILIAGVYILTWLFYKNKIIGKKTQ